MMGCRIGELSMLAEGTYEVVKTGCETPEEFIPLSQQGYDDVSAGMESVLATQLLDYDNLEKISLLIETNFLTLKIAAKNCTYTLPYKVVQNHNGILRVEQSQNYFGEPKNCAMFKTIIKKNKLKVTSVQFHPASFLNSYRELDQQEQISWKIKKGKGFIYLTTDTENFETDKGKEFEGDREDEVDICAPSKKVTWLLK